MSKREICAHGVVGGKGSTKMGCKFKIRTKKNKKRIGLIEMQICLSAIKVDDYFNLTDSYLVYPIFVIESV